MMKKHTFNSWIILVNKVVLAKLDSERRFTHATTAYHDQFILTERLSLNVSNDPDHGTYLGHHFPDLSR